jgi:hypothetical protein
MRNAGLCDRGRERGAGANMNSDAECKDAPVFPENVEARRQRIDRRVPVGGRQNDQHRVPLFHLPSGDYSLSGEEAARVLHGRIVSKDFLNEIMKNTWIALDAFVQPRMRNQSE